MAAWRYEISLLELKKYFTRSLRSFVKYFSTLEEKFRITARPCNILYISSQKCPLFYLHALFLFNPRASRFTTRYWMAQILLAGTNTKKQERKKRVFWLAPKVPILQLAKNCANAGSKFAYLGALESITLLCMCIAYSGPFSRFPFLILRWPRMI